MPKQRRIYIAIPSRTGEVKVETCRAIIKGMTECAAEGWAITLGESLECIAPISIARNLAVARFLATDYDDLFFIDDDVAWADGAMVRLLKAPVDLVAGVYPRRYPDISFPVQWDTSKAEVWADPATGLIEVHGVATGFMRISRAGILRMVAHYKDDIYSQAQAPGGKVHRLFDFALVPDETGKVHEVHSEDYTFCDRWRAMGGKVWIDPHITFMHLGVAAFSGNVGEWLRDRSITSAMRHSGDKPRVVSVPLVGSAA